MMLSCPKGWGETERGDGMTARDMAGMIGREFGLTEGPFRFRVLVDDVKVSYGTPRAYVSPVGGSGWAWVAADRLSEWAV